MNSLLNPETKEAFLAEKKAALEELERLGWSNIPLLDVNHAIASDELEWHMRRLRETAPRKAQ